MIRESFNKTTIQGTLVENNLELLNNEQLGTFISGDLVVRVGESDIKVNFFAKELKKDGGFNKIHKSLIGVMTYPSIASDGVGVKVSITGGSISVNDFYTDELEHISYSELKSNFVKKSTKNYKEENIFEFEGLVRRVYDEVKEDAETGRLAIEVVGVNYAESALPVIFVVEKESAINYIRAYYAPGKTVKVNGNIVFSTEKVSKTEESAFGEPIIKEYDKVTKDFVITAGTQPYDENEYTAEDAKVIMENRNIMLEGKKADKVKKLAGNSAAKPSTGKPVDKKGAFPF